MTRIAFASLVAISLLGCNNEPPSGNNEIIPVGSSSANNATTSSANMPATSGGSNEASNASSNKPYGGVKNPDRLHQTDNLQVTTIKTKAGDLKLWVMDTESKRQEGMMFLQDNEVKNNEGMIFVFPEVKKLSGNYAFWMHNTKLALDIDYISKDKKVINVGVGKPMSDDKVKPMGDYFYVIELKQGMSAKYGLTPGTKVDISNDLVGQP